MLIDDVTIEVRAGSGGDGGVGFNNNMMSLGPTGGNGGDGGSVYMEGVSDLAVLQQFRYKKEIQAESGGRGRAQFVDGGDGRDIVLKIPVGTVIYNLNGNTSQEIIKVGERMLIAKGGRGGKGNYKFRSPRNTSPREFQPGMRGEECRLRLEMKLIADVGFIGLPNVGKSSVLNELTNARSKVANYKFTTLEPNLGSYRDLILADIPGLIEGASSGKGLGIKFLRHIERTRQLFHFISAESETPEEDYRTIRTELGTYNPELLEKEEKVFLSKTDVLTPAGVKKKVARLKNLNPRVWPVSIHDAESLDSMKKILDSLNNGKVL